MLGIRVRVSVLLYSLERGVISGTPVDESRLISLGGYLLLLLLLSKSSHVVEVTLCKQASPGRVVDSSEMYVQCGSAVVVWCGFVPRLKNYEKSNDARRTLPKSLVRLLIFSTMYHDAAVPPHNR